MEQNQIELSYNGSNTIMQCKANEKLKDIFKNFKFKVRAENKILIYMYNGVSIENEDLTFGQIANSEDKKRHKMNILVIEDEEQVQPQQDSIIKSKNIICPECNEDIKFKVEDYVINLYECKNKHDIDNIFFDKFNSTQNINISKIICQIFGKYNKGNVHNNIFYKCNTCKKDLCPICSSSHDKNHNIINYDDKNYICEQHNKTYIAYCENCKENICVFCEQNHNKHNIINYGKLIPNEDKINGILKQLDKLINILKSDIDEIIEKLNNIKNNFELYYNINKNIINSFSKEKINYEILNNINQINNADIIKEVKNIINDNSILNKFKLLINIYNKMNSYNSVSLTYNIDKKDNEINIFGEEFVKNNIYNCTMMIDNKEYKLSEKFNIQNYNKDKIIIRLKRINNITNLSYMFNNCTSLSSLPDLSKLNTTKINDMRMIFSYCSSLTSLPDISKWDTSNVNNMSFMFNNCNALKSLPDISKWNTSNVKDMWYMFSDCEALKKLPDISKWDTSKVENMNSMFYNCYSLKLVPDISKWNTSKVKDMGNMFCHCESLISLPDLGKWNISNLECNEKMFEFCYNLKTKPKFEIKKRGILKKLFG